MFLTVLKIQLDEGLFLILMKEPDFTSAEGRKFAKKTTFIMEISLKFEKICLQMTFKQLFRGNF